MDSKTVVMVFSVVLFCSFLLVDDCLGQSRTWNSRDGKHKIEGAVERVDKEEGNVVLRLKDGTKRSVSISDLSKKDQTYISFKFGVTVDKDLRTWTSSKGKKIRAKLLKFENNKVYLQSPEGKNYAPIPLDRLSVADQAFVSPPRALQPTAKGGRYLQPVPEVEAILDESETVKEGVAKLMQLNPKTVHRGLAFYTYSAVPYAKYMNPRELLAYELRSQYEPADFRESYEYYFKFAEEVLANSSHSAERAAACLDLARRYDNPTSLGGDRQKLRDLVSVQRECLESGEKAAVVRAISLTMFLKNLAEPNRELLEEAADKFPLPELGDVWMDSIDEEVD